QLNGPLTGQCKFFLERPTQHVNYPLCFPVLASSTPTQTTAGQNILAQTLWDLNVVADRTAKPSSLDAIVNGIITRLDRLKVTMGDGNWIESTFETIFSQPYGIEADQYPRHIVRIRLTHTFN